MHMAGLLFPSLVSFWGCRRGVLVLSGAGCPPMLDVATMDKLLGESPQYHFAAVYGLVAQGQWLEGQSRTAEPTFVV